MKHLITLLLLQAIHLQLVTSQIIRIGTTGDYPNLEAAESFIAAGDTLLLQSETFSDGTQFLENLNGTHASPIVILAQDEHQSIFQGGTEAIHLVNCSHVEINGLVIQQQTGNGINIDDGGDYTTPSRHITIRNCIFRDMAGMGNNDLLKMSGVDSFLIERCHFINGGNGGSGVDFVGCHWGTVQDCYFDAPGTSGIQNKGGTQFIRMQRNTFKNVSQRALNLGGSTGLQFFRPPLPNPIVDAFEAADLEVFSNVFIGSWAPIAYVGCVRVKVYNNTFYAPENWVIRILQETTTPGFLTCSDNEFRNNIVYLSNDLTEVNISPNTAPESFIFSNNCWFNASSNAWAPVLPVTDVDHIIDNPLFENPANEDFRIPPMSPAVGAGILLAEPTTDFDQVPFQQPPSVGAFEGSDIPSHNNPFIEDDWIQVFPNPSSGAIHIDGPLGHVSIQLMNHLGQMIQEYPDVHLPYSLNLNRLPNGMYFMLIEDLRLDRAIWKKIIKE